MLMTHERRAGFLASFIVIVMGIGIENVKRLNSLQVFCSFVECELCLFVYDRCIVDHTSHDHQPWPAVDSYSYRTTLFNNVLRGIMQCRLV